MDDLRERERERERIEYWYQYAFYFMAFWLKVMRQVFTSISLPLHNFLCDHSLAEDVPCFNRNKFLQHTTTMVKTLLKIHYSNCNCRNLCLQVYLPLHIAACSPYLMAISLVRSILMPDGWQRTDHTCGFCSNLTTVLFWERAYLITILPHTIGSTAFSFISTTVWPHQLLYLHMFRLSSLFPSLSFWYGKLFSIVMITF